MYRESNSKQKMNNEMSNSNPLKSEMHIRAIGIDSSRFIQSVFPYFIRSNVHNEPNVQQYIQPPHTKYTNAANVQQTQLVNSYIVSEV